MFSIEQVSTQDISRIRTLTFKVWPQTYQAILSQEQIAYMLDMMYSEVSLHRQFADGAVFIIVKEKNEDVGFASYQQLSDDLFKLHKLYVLPSQQGKGTGKLLINYIESSIQQTFDCILQLQVNRSNTAVSFYKKLGFHVKEEKQLDIGQGYIMDDYIMEKQIPGSKPSTKNA